jgi:hypothetical protein
VVDIELFVAGISLIVFEIWFEKLMISTTITHLGRQIGILTSNLAIFIDQNVIDRIYQERWIAQNWIECATDWVSESPATGAGIGKGRG